TPLIGSSKYPQDFQKWTSIWGLLGHQVWYICVPGHHMKNFDMTGNAKRLLDAAYMDKIRRCDHVFVVNDQQYIGLGTLDELLYAVSCYKHISFAQDIKDQKCKEEFLNLAKGEGYMPSLVPVELIGECGTKISGVTCWVLNIPILEKFHLNIVEK
ncbi:MAG: hypothetical protein K2H85_07010, partial [Allobaculum sp.]|nr:hypothetical protein [Allobaculum sp.]